MHKHIGSNASKQLLDMQNLWTIRNERVEESAKFSHKSHSKQCLEFYSDTNCLGHEGITFPRSTDRLSLKGGNFKMRRMRTYILSENTSSEFHLLFFAD